MLVGLIITSNQLNAWSCFVENFLEFANFSFLKERYLDEGKYENQWNDTDKGKNVSVQRETFPP